MQIKPILEKDRETFNLLAPHPLQSYEWGEFREKTGIKVIKRGFFENNKLVAAFQLTIHTIPYMPWTIGYFPKGTIPTKETVEELYRIGKQEKCIFIQLEPTVIKQSGEEKIKALKVDSNHRIVESVHPLFTKYTFILDLTKTEQELLTGMHPKTRYNIKIAQKHGVEVKEDNSSEAFDAYMKITEETTKRQKFYAHSASYHQLQWHLLAHTNEKNKPTSHLFTARYQSKVLTTLMLFVFHDTLYYPYGASSNEQRNVMHSTLAMWEAIKFGKKLGLKTFDMWGALGENPDPNDPWFGFHRFKQGFGATPVEFIGSYDLVINPLLYKFFSISDKLRWLYLKIKK